MTPQVDCCRDCTYWEEGNDSPVSLANKGEGKCQLLSLDDTPETSVYTDKAQCCPAAGADSWWFITAADFGCSLFEARR